MVGIPLLHSSESCRSTQQDQIQLSSLQLILRVDIPSPPSCLLSGFQIYEELCTIAQHVRREVRDQRIAHFTALEADFKNPINYNRMEAVRGEWVGN